MHLEALHVLHLPKTRPNGSESCDAVLPRFKTTQDFFFLDTCQRSLWVGNLNQIDPESLKQTKAEVYKGQAAYHFLLRVATGLASEVLGETDVFGQFKEAWKKNQSSCNCCNAGLGPWIQRLFEDTKEIRSR